MAADERGGQRGNLCGGIYRDEAHAAAAHRGDARDHAVHRETVRAHARSGIGNRESGIEGTGSRCLRFPIPYSARSAVTGLTPSARRAGTIAASAPAMIRTNATRT